MSLFSKDGEWEERGVTTPIQSSFIIWTLPPRTQRKWKESFDIACKSNPWKVMAWAANSQQKVPLSWRMPSIVQTLSVYSTSFHALFGIVHSSVKFLYDLQNRRLIHTMQFSSSGCAIDFSVRTAESSEANKSGTPRRASPVKSSKRREIRVPSTPLGRVLGWATSLSFVQCVEVLVSLFVPRGGGLLIGNPNDVCGSLWN